MSSERVTLVDPSGRSWRVPSNRLHAWHTVTIGEQSWHMTHPITCDLDVCPFDDIAQRWELPPDVPGVYQWHSIHETPERMEAEGD